MASTSPKASPKSASDNQLYEIKIVEEKGDRVKVHYVGYSKKEDEWKRRDELVLLDNGATDGATEAETINGSLSLWQPFSLYQELGSKIKANLQSSRKESPCVKIDMSFDKINYSMMADWLK